MPYTVFTNEQRWSLVHNPNSSICSSSKKIHKVFQLFKEQRMTGNVEFPFPTLKELNRAWESLSSKFDVIEAAGGIVKNDSDKILFILRREKWDLPKGKLEKGETIEEGAVREVAEECGINPTLKNKIGETWHTYSMGKKNVLKRTYWFAMHCSDEEAALVKPQIEEEIETVAWLSPEEIEEIVSPNTFKSIQSIYQQFI